MSPITFISISMILISYMIMVIEFDMNPSVYEQYFACNSSMPTVGSATNSSINTISSYLPFLGNNFVDYVILFGISVFLVVLPFVILKNDWVPEVVDNSIILRLLMYNGFAGMIAFGFLYILMFIIYLISQTSVSCAG